MEKQPKKKKSKVQRVLELSEKGMDIKQISEKMKLSPRVVRAYLWRAKHPEEYRKMLQKYFEKRRQKKETQELQAAAKQNSK